MIRQTVDSLYVTTLIVEGSCQFPLDMLRYDNCVPVSSEDAARIEDTLRNRAEGRTRITLRRYGMNKGLPTIDRWRSFLWSVVSVTTLTGEDLLHGGV